MPRRPGLAVVSILHAIARGTAYGFDLIEETGYPGGTVYPALSRLERDGYLASSWEHPAQAREEKRPPRRYYRLTPQGARMLDTELARLKSMHLLSAVPQRRRR